MGSEDGACNETTITHGALVRPLARVQPLVDGNRGELCEGFSTITALVRFFSCMASLVNCQIPLSRKAFPANIANARFFSSMSFYVVIHRHFIGKPFTTEEAGKRVDALVLKNMAFQTIFSRESLSTQITNVTFLWLITRRMKF